MSDIEKVKQLREATGAGFKDCNLAIKESGGDLDKVELEDQEIVEATQRGVLSKSYERGRYSPKMETGVHHFHRILTSNG